MGLRCLLGHDFGDPEIQRERQENGDEMVVTLREIKTCRRCGLEQVVSENKEVTSIRPPVTESISDTDADAAADRDAASGEGDGSTTEPGAAEPTPGSDTDSSTGVTSAIEEAEDEPFEPPQSAEEDDGIILEDDDEEELERQPGEWPDSSDVGRADRTPTLEEVEGELDSETSPGQTSADEADTDDTTPWPEQRGEDEGFSAEPSDGDTSDVDFGNKLAPELGDDDRVREGYDAEFIGDAGDDESEEYEGPPSGGFTRAETLSQADAADFPTEYYCPECEMTRSADQSSMRAGDICPECRHGYVTERQR